MKIWETDTFLARWLSDDLTHEEKKAFEQSEEFAQFQQIKAAMDDFESPVYDEANALEAVMSRINSAEQNSNVVSMKAWHKYAAAAAIFVATLLGIYFALFNDRIMEYTAEEQMEIMLPDGSSTTLKAGSFIRYNESEWNNARTVELKGEAFFSVTKGQTFKVGTKHGSVTVLGTSFTVFEKQDSLIVSCYSGKVKVEAFDEAQLLTKGMKVNLSPGLKLQDSVLLSEPLWLDQIASFEDVDLAQVFRQFEKLYDVKIKGGYNQQLKYTGQFPTDDLKVALDQIFGPYQMKYEFNAPEREVTINPAIE